jgi:hypothetical protein
MPTNCLVVKTARSKQTRRIALMRLREIPEGRLEATVAIALNTLFSFQLSGDERRSWRLMARSALGYDSSNGQLDCGIAQLGRCRAPEAELGRPFLDLAEVVSSRDAVLVLLSLILQPGLFLLKLLKPVAAGSHTSGLGKVEDAEQADCDDSSGQ